MKITPEELADHGYLLLHEMGHNDLIPFVKTWLNKRNFFSAAYYLSIFISFGSLLFFFLKFHRTSALTTAHALRYAFIGFMITLALIPLHEFIHVLAYKWVGARQTSYDVNFKKFYFLAVAHRFVANKKEFRLVALAPFVVISAVLIACIFFAGSSWTIAFSSTLLVHASFCSGDFALLGYFQVHQHKDIVTYDDKENKISFFYGKSK